MKRYTVLAGAIAVAVVAAAPSASAQTPPIDGNIHIGGYASSTLELTITQPAAATFSTFTKARTYSTSFTAAVTATDPGATLTLADGDAASKSDLGYLTSGRHRLSDPLQAAVKGAFAPLNTTLDPQLTRWSDIVSDGPATVRLRQKVTSRSTRTFHKVLLVTLSSETP